MRRNWFESGNHNAICDICGFKRKASQMIARWDGMMVCMPSIKQGCWEIRHPQDLIKPMPDQQAPAWTRPEATDQYLAINYAITYCTIEGQYGQSDYGTADCSIVGNVNGGLIP